MYAMWFIVFLGKYLNCKKFTEIRPRIKSKSILLARRKNERIIEIWMIENCICIGNIKRVCRRITIEIGYSVRNQIFSLDLHSHLTMIEIVGILKKYILKNIAPRTFGNPLSSVRRCKKRKKNAAFSLFRRVKFQQCIAVIHPFVAGFLSSRNSVQANTR